MRTPKPILERRRSVRVEERLPFWIGCRGYEIQASTVNLSSHGALCVVDKDIRAMTRLEIGIELPATRPSAGGPAASSKPIRAQGVVVRKEEDSNTGKFFLAIYFSGMKPADQKLLDEFIARRLP